MKVLIATQAQHQAEYIDHLQRKSTRPSFEFSSAFPPDQVDVMVYEPKTGFDDFSIYEKLQLVQSIWAGVDSIVDNPSLQVPLCRMVDDGLRLGMREYVTGHILADHIEISRFERAKAWNDRWLNLAKDKVVGIVGMGRLGLACAEALTAMGFRVIGWSRKSISGDFEIYHDHSGLMELLSYSDYVVTLLPHTPKTHDIINDEFLSAMKPDAMLINPGRGGLLDEDALLKALHSGYPRRAVLDVFKTEPLPTDHPFWTNARILVTPHIAAKSRVETACELILDNLERLADGRELLHLVDRQSGY